MHKMEHIDVIAFDLKKPNMNFIIKKKSKREIVCRWKLFDLEKYFVKN